MADDWFTAEGELIAGSTTTDQDHSMDKKPRVGCQLLEKDRRHYECRRC